MADDNQTITDSEAEDIAAGKPVDDGYLKLPLGIESKPLPNGQKIVITQFNIGPVLVSKNRVAVIRPKDRVQIWSKGGFENFVDALLLVNNQFFPVENGSFEQTNGNRIVFRIPEGESSLISEGAAVKIVLVGRNYQAEVDKSLVFLPESESLEELEKKAKAAQERAERLKQQQGAAGGGFNLAGALSDIASVATGGALNDSLLTQIKNSIRANDNNRLDSLLKQASQKGETKIIEEALKAGANVTQKNILQKHLVLAQRAQVQIKERAEVRSKGSVNTKAKIQTTSAQAGAEVDADTEVLESEVTTVSQNQMTSGVTGRISESGTATASTIGVRTVSSGSTAGGQSVNISAGAVAASQAGNVSTTGTITGQQTVSAKVVGVSGGAGSNQSTSEVSVSEQQQAQTTGQASLNQNVQGGAQNEINATVSTQAVDNDPKNEPQSNQTGIQGELQQNVNVSGTANLGGGFSSGGGTTQFGGGFGVQNQVSQNISGQIKKEGESVEEPEFLEQESENSKQPNQGEKEAEISVQQQNTLNVKATPLANKGFGTVNLQNEAEPELKVNVSSKAGEEILARIRASEKPSNLNKALERVNMRQAGDDRAPKSSKDRQQPKSGGRGSSGSGAPLGGSTNRVKTPEESENEQSPGEQLGGSEPTEEAESEPAGESKEASPKSEAPSAPGQEPKAEAPKEPEKKQPEAAKEKEPENQQEQETPEPEAPSLPPATNAAKEASKEAIGQAEKAIAKNLARSAFAIIWPYILATLAFFAVVIGTTVLIVATAYVGCLKFPPFKLAYPQICETLENIGKAGNTSTPSGNSTSSATGFTPTPTPASGGVNAR